MKTYKLNKSAIRAVLWIAFLTTFVTGQERPKDKTMKVNTRIVFIDVRDEKNRKPVIDIESGDLEQLVDGVEQDITYFSKGGFEECPLTLALYFNLAPNGAARYLSDVATQRSLKDPLETPGDDDNVMALAPDDWFEGLVQVVVPPTRDWNNVAMKIGAVVGKQVVAVGCL